MAKTKKKDFTAFFVPAGIFIGMGVGFVIDKFIGGLFIGLGAGFLCVAIVKFATK